MSDVTNCVEVPSRRQSDLPLVPPPRKSSYGVTLDEIQLQRMPSLPLKKRMSKKLRQGSGFLRNLKEKNNALKNGKLEVIIKIINTKFVFLGILLLMSYT